MAAPQSSGVLERVSGMLVGIVVSVAIIAAISIGPNTPNAKTLPTTAYPQTGFGGYRLDAVVHTISAEWRVPEIATDSNPGYAATWVGADEADGSHFIQIGTNETRYASAGSNTYETFWSDSAVGFHPHHLATVFAGDLIRATMTQNQHGWQLKSTDLTKHPTLSASGSTSSHLEIATGVGQSYVHAQWMQEDPAPSIDSAVDLTYPKIAITHFSRVLLNQSAPNLSLDNAVVIFPNHGPILAPTPLHNDAFDYVRPTGVARQYLLDARAVDASYALFKARVVNWYDTPLASRAQFALQAARAYSKFANALAHQRWPSDARNDVLNDIAAVRLQSTFFSSWIGYGLTFSNATYARFTRIANYGHLQADTLRLRLGLPPT